MPTAEDYLRAKLPNYERERQLYLPLLLICNALFWVVVFPLLFGSGKKDFESNNDQSVIKPVSKVDNNKKSNTKSKRKIKDTASKSTETRDKDINVSVQEAPFSLLVSFTSTAGLIIGTLLVILNCSSYNTFQSLRVFEFPFLLDHECDQLMQMADQAALENYKQITNNTTNYNDTDKGYLIEPYGWQKYRHNAYPTTDLNLVTDPFSHLDWLARRLNARLAPMLSRIYGIPAAAIRANDLFIVRYDDKDRTSLSPHTDSADISINLLLNNNFTGGGTRFYSASGAHLVQPFRRGNIITHSSQLRHEGVHITNGQRWILVGFLSVDRVNPWDVTQSTGLSIWASWLRATWAFTRLKEAYNWHLRGSYNSHAWYNHKTAQVMIKQLTMYMARVPALFREYKMEILVNKGKAEEFITELDREAQDINNIAKASWFKGQQINLNIDGTIQSEWKHRTESTNRFQEL